MFRRSLLGIAALIVSIAALASSGRAQPVEYVRICSVFGVGYIYIPGTDTCLHVSTGLTKRTTETGTVTDVSDTLRRIKALESLRCDDCFGVISGQGTILSADGVQNVVRFSTGSYTVQFRRNVDTCAYIATIGDNQPLVPGFVTVQSRAPTAPKAVIVRTFNRLGSATDRGFHISAECPFGL